MLCRGNCIAFSLALLRMIGIKNKHEKVTAMLRDLVPMIETTHSRTHYITDLVYIGLVQCVLLKFQE